MFREPGVIAGPDVATEAQSETEARHGNIAYRPPPICTKNRGSVGWRRLQSWPECQIGMTSLGAPHLSGPEMQTILLSIRQPPMRARSSPLRSCPIPATALVALAVLAALGPAVPVRAVCAAELRLAGETNPVRLMVAVVASAARKIAVLDQSGFGHAMVPIDSPAPSIQVSGVMRPTADRIAPRWVLAERLLDLPPPAC